MKQCILAAVLFFVFSLKTFSQSGNKLIKEGDAQTNALHYSQAIHYYTDAIAKLGDDKDNLAQAHIDRAVAETNLHQNHKAIADCNFANTLDSANFQSYFVLGYAYDDSGLYDRSIACYSKSIQMRTQGKLHGGDKTDLAVIYSFRGIAYSDWRQYDKCFADFNYSLTLNSKNNQDNWQRGEAYNLLGQFEQAVNDYTIALTLYKKDKKNSSEIYSARGFSKYMLKQYQPAIDDETQALTIDATNADAYSDRGRIYLALNNTRQAMADFSAALKVDTTKLERSYELFFIGKTDSAIALLQHKLSGEVKNSYDEMNDYYYLACYMAMMNKPDEAVSYLKSAIQHGWVANYAKADADFDSIKQNPAFISLIK